MDEGKSLVEMEVEFDQITRIQPLAIRGPFAEDPNTSMRSLSPVMADEWEASINWMSAEMYDHRHYPGPERRGWHQRTEPRGRSVEEIVDNMYDSYLHDYKETLNFRKAIQPDKQTAEGTITEAESWMYGGKLAAEQRMAHIKAYEEWQAV
jgi:hypothetical protein